MPLTDEERREIEDEVATLAERRAAGMGALRIVQRHRGWISDETLRDVAEFMGETPHELDAVAIGYSLIFRKPVGRHVILVCDTVSCWILGYNAVREHLSRRLGIGLGQTTPDGRFTLLPVACLGACDHAPAMMIDDDLHGDLTPETIDRILEKYP
jgi:NADH-quinone oxidoreductase subunit E